MKLKTQSFSDMVVRCPRELEAAFEQLRTPEPIRNELRVAWAESGRSDGSFQISCIRIIHSYGDYARKQLTKFFDRAGLVERVGTYRPNQSCQSYRFVIAGLSDSMSNRYTRAGLGSGLGCTNVESVAVVIPRLFLEERARLWAECCRSFNWSLRLDYFGATEAGSATQETLAKIVLPDVSSAEIDLAATKPESASWIKTFLARRRDSIVGTVKRTRHRLYHALSNLPKQFRSLLQMETRKGPEKCVSIDMSATYVTLLVGQMHDCEERKKLIQLLQTGQFYERLNEALPESQRYSDRGKLKCAFQRDCLFWKDDWTWVRPIWQALKSLFPRLAAFIASLRRKMSPGKLYDWLCSMEFRIFAGGALVQCARAGIAALPIHDCLVVAQSCADRALEIIEQMAVSVLGFRPSLKVE